MFKNSTAEVLFMYHDFKSFLEILGLKGLQLNALMLNKFKDIYSGECQ